MRLIAPSSEDEMVSVFLRAEVDSDRFGPALSAELQRSGADDDLLLTPNLDDDAENRLRRQLLEHTRAYLSRDGLFAGFPEDVRWDRVAFTPDEVMAVRYIDYSYWVELSGGTRRPADAAARMRRGLEVFGVPNHGFFELSRELTAGVERPELIVVSASPEGGDVVLEGHARLTAMALAAAALPPESEVIRGVSPQIVDWALY